MTRKTYEKKMRNFKVQLYKYNNKKMRDIRMSRPKFGYVPEIGLYKGQPVISYKMMWEIMVDTFKGTPLEDLI